MSSGSESHGGGGSVLRGSTKASSRGKNTMPFDSWSNDEIIPF